MWLKYFLSAVFAAAVTMVAPLPPAKPGVPPYLSPSLAPAEALFRTGQVAEARLLLRQVVAADPKGEAAAEAECRLGQSYEDAGDPAHAIAAYLACRRLRGGDAADMARRRVEVLLEARASAVRHLAGPEDQAVRAARASLRALARPGLTATERTALERRLTVALARACGALFGPPTDGNALLPPAITVVRSPDLREILRYLSVMPAEPTTTPASRRAALLAFAQTAHSPALRSGALLAAALIDSMTPAVAQSPDRLLATVTPVPLPAAVTADPAVVFLTQAAGRDGLRMEVDPRMVVEEDVSMLRDRLIRLAYDEGRLEDMLRYDMLLPGPTNVSDIASSDVAMYRRYPDFDHAPLRLFAQASAQEHSVPAAALPLFLALAQKYPASALASPSLLAAETLLRQAHRETEADALRAQILRDYPRSPAALLSQAQSAAAHDALGDAEALLARADPSAAMAGPGGPDWAARDLSDGTSLLRDLIHRTLQVREALRPVAVAAGRPALAEVPEADVGPLEDRRGNEEAALVAFADRLADAMPSQAVAVYRALMPSPPFLDLPLSLHALSRDPLGPTTITTWEALTSESAVEMGVFSRPAPADDVALASALLERTAGTPRAAQALTLFERVVGGGRGISTGDWRLALAAAQAAADANAEMRVGVAARCVAARTLLENARPEDAAALLVDNTPVLAADDPVWATAALLRRRAAEEVAAKRGLDWTPLWQAQVGPLGKVVIDSYAPDTPPGIVGGTLVALWPGNAPEDIWADRGWAGLAGLDPTTGARKWATPVGSAVRDVALTAGRAFAFTQAGDLVAMDAATGRVLYRLPLAAGTHSAEAGWVVATVTALVAVTERGVWGLDPATGRTRWHQDWILSGIRTSPEKPALIGGTLYCQTTDGHLRAVNPATGAVLWDRLTAADDPSYSGRINGGQPVPAGPRTLLRRGDALQAWDAVAGRPLPAARQVPGRVWMDGLLSDGRVVVKWDQNMPGDVSLLPDLAALDVQIAPKPEEEHGLLRSGVLYAAVRDSLTNGMSFQAVDVATGAVLAWWPLGGFSAGSWAGADDKCVYLACANGSVRAFRLLGVSPLKDFSRPRRRRASSQGL